MASVGVTADSCPICTDPFTVVTRRALECPSCHYRVCLPRARKCLLISPSVLPGCVSCKGYFNGAFLDSQFSAAWLNGPYRHRRGEKLADQERSLLPHTQVAATAEKERREHEKVRQEVFVEVAALRRQLQDATRRYETARQGGPPPPSVSQ